MPVYEMSPVPNTIVHLGARRGERLPEFQDMGAQRIILVEPESDMSAKLARRLSKQSDVYVVAAAIAEVDGQGELSVMNLPQLNSLAEPAPALQALYPGLRVRERQQVQLLSPQRFLSEVGHLGHPIMLVVEAPGSEQSIFKALKISGLLDQIDLLEIRCAEDVLYKGATSRANLEAWLLDEGFAVSARNAEDPDWPVLQLYADHKARALLLAEARLVEYAGTVAKLEAALEGKIQHIVGLETKVGELEKVITETNTIIAQRDADIQSATEQVATFERTVAQLQQAIAKSDAIIAQREADFKAATDRAAALDTSIAQLRKKNAQLTDDQQRVEFDLRGARRDLGLALRQQERLQADLSDLHERYETVQTVRRDQDDLLRRLTPRLREAASHLQHLTLPGTTHKVSGPSDEAQ